MSQIAQYVRATSISGLRDADEPDQLESLLERQYELGFSRGFVPTVGLEEELILVRPESLEPACEAAGLLEKLGDRRFSAELRDAQIELVMPVCVTVSDLRRELAAARARLFEVADGEVRAIGAGAHPAATAAAGVTDRPRYRDIERDYPWAVRRGMTCGLHVHVGVSDPDEALAVYNAARSYLPEIAALGANSPFVDGSDSGLASARLKLTEELPRAGIPPAFASWRDLARFVAWGSSAGLFADLTYLWWDLRPRPEYGTVEFRVADSQTSVAASTAIAALCQSLVVALGNRHRAGEELVVHETHVLNENRWLALRDGVDGRLADPETGVVEPTRERLGRLLFELEPVARSLGCAEELALAWPLVAENGARRQRAVEGDVAEVLAWLADETERPDEREAPGAARAEGAVSRGAGVP
ncbi:MAG TPA: YbdK family carboxylate-amine ligase [Gaiellaceae bacterium]|nr:YbdK family carboxylate-amine ligase [Gaiellaceae bacterium]